MYNIPNVPFRVITLEKFPTHIMLSKKRRAKYDIDITGKQVLLNAGTAGTPKFEKINGQAIYSGNMFEHTRNKMVNEMTKFILEKLAQEEPIYLEENEYLLIRGEVHTVINQDDYRMLKGVLNVPKNMRKKSRWDVGNLWIWSKVHDDTLVEGMVIEDDNISIVRGTGELLFFPIKDFEQRKLVFNIFKITEI